ncbi:hypothetical protein DVH24_032533 [Malus domestica]|uniref:Uncharacterized protein n=1 Tax=Malus domestica TaxID=3750 RepID=A0A498J4P6_MALDO|nr:hypothetical protein DVH24_032533 [Malus domestica]
MDESGGFGVGSGLVLGGGDELVVVLQNHLDRGGAQPVGDGQPNLLHFLLELFQIHRPTLVVVELVEYGVVQLRQLLWRGGHIDAEVGLNEPEGLEGFAELRSGEDAVAVGGVGGAQTGLSREEDEDGEREGGRDEKRDFF